MTSGDEGRAAALALGRQVYEFNCYFCHGYSGDAKTLAARTLNPPPLNFLTALDLTPERVETAVRVGRPGTAMKSFASRLSDAEIAAVAVYVATGLSGATAYHTEANGWPDHQQRNGPAFPFVNGEIMLDTPDAELSPQEIAGRELFRTACANCHEGRQSEGRAEIFRRIDANTGE